MMKMNRSEYCGRPLVLSILGSMTIFLGATMPMLVIVLNIGEYTAVEVLRSFIYVITPAILSCLGTLLLVLAFVERKTSSIQDIPLIDVNEES